MKKLIILFTFTIATTVSYTQYIHKIKADSVLITNDSCTAELNLENSTKNVLGFLYNKGRGRTEFRRGLVKVNDSIYVIGADTLNLADGIPPGLSANPPISSLSAAVATNTINNANYTQQWQWNTLAGANGLSLTSTSTAAASGLQRLLNVSLSGTNATASQSTYAGYFSNTHAAPSSDLTTNYGIYSNATANTFSNIAGAFNVSGNTEEGRFFGVYATATNSATDKTNTHAGYFSNNGGNIVIKIGQENASAIAGIGFVGASQSWGVGKRGTNGNFVFNNSIYFSGGDVLTLVPAGRVVIGTDDGSRTFQVDGTSRFSADILVNGQTIGRGAGNQVTNTAHGNNALPANTTGMYNTAIGINALLANTTGGINTAVGANAMQVNTTGGNNTTVGANSMQFNTSGSNNTALGYLAMQHNTTGGNNVAVGYNCMATNTTGSSNTAVGRNAMAANSTGINNTAMGYLALQDNSTAAGNNAFGVQALYKTTTGGGNFAAGYNAMYWNTTGASNNAVGNGALYNNTSGGNNAALGNSALLNNTTGNHNVALGHSTGSSLTSGDYNILIGSGVQPPVSTTGSNQLNIGNWIYGDNGKIGIGVSAPAARLNLAAGTATANTAPLKFTSGTNLTTPESGAVEYDGTNYYVSNSSGRFTMAKTLTATAALNFASTAAGTSTDLTITVTGAVDGDAVSVGVPNASIVSNGCFTAWVSATNTVTVRFSNNDLTNALDPASGTFRVSVIRY